jgi:hypothetical protein
MGGNVIFRHSIVQDITFDRIYTPSEDRVFGSECFLRARTFYTTHSVWYCYVQHPTGLSRNYSVEQVRSLLDIQLELLKKSKTWPWFAEVQDIAYSKLFGVYLGWDYELVFHKNNGEEELKSHYFAILNKMLDCVGNNGGLQVKLRVLRFISAKKLSFALFLYRIPATFKRRLLTGIRKSVLKYRERANNH